jgi:four helix bundle protein
MNSYRELLVWQRGMEIAKLIYKLTSQFPKSEQYGLISQLQRAAVSIPANIAEGHACDSTKDYLRHLSIVRGSLAELETLLIISRDFNYIDSQTCGDILSSLDELSRMLRGLQNALRQKLNK